MKQCKQTDSQSVYEHGVSVCQHLTQLISYLDNPEQRPSNWRIPSWLETYRSELRSALLPIHVLKTYTLYHDCGKPLCVQYDAEGKRHFPNHAQVSYETWLEMGGDPQVANLILKDMWIHTMKAAEVEAFCSQPEAASLLLVGLCEVHSNAELFGGIDSVSFKMKWKHLDKRGRAICKRLFGDRHEMA